MPVPRLDLVVVIDEWRDVLEYLMFGFLDAEDEPPPARTYVPAAESSPEPPRPGFGSDCAAALRGFKGGLIALIAHTVT